MLRTRTIGWMVLALVGLLVFGRAPRAAETTELATQEERQKQIKAETDRLVRRVETMIRLLEYNRLDKSAEKQLLDQVAGTLSGLSREQMLRLIAALEKAGKAEGAAREDQLKQVEERHEQIVLGLKGLLARFDAVKSLDQAAERLEKLARDELDQYLQNTQMSWEEENGTNPRRSEDARLLAQKLAGEQTFLHRDLSTLLEQLAELQPLLPPEHQERYRRMQAALRATNLLDNLVTASRHLRFTGATAERRRQWRKAADMQWQASGDLQELARQLGGESDKLTALREARQKVERALDDQEGVEQGTRTPPEKEKPDARPEEMTELNHLWARGLSSRQASLEFDTRATRAVLQPHVKELAGRLGGIEKTMRTAQTALRDQATRRPPIAQALQPQETALVQLREVAAELDRLLAAAEKEQTDPLSSVRDTLAQVEQLIKEQKDVRDKADEAGKAQQTQRLPHLEPKQRDLTRRAEEINRQPSAAKPQAKEALSRAAQAMEQAAKPLQDKQAAKAVERQDQALAKLEEAKKALAEQAAEIEKRRDDIARLEDADRKLDEMIRKESKVASETHDKAKKPEAADAKALAKKQGELTPQARQLGKELEKSAPEAAKHVEAGSKHMDAARSDLDRKQLPPAAKNADKAVEKLQEARKAVAQKLDDKKGMEAADQAAMQPEIDPANAAEQIAKALEQTEQAAKDSGQAAKQPEANKDAARMLTRSRRANQSAMAALAQAQAQAPGIVKPHLSKAGEQLAKANQKLQQGAAQPANQAQGQAASQLKQALAALNSAMAQAGEKGEGQSKGQGQSQAQGQGQGKGQGQAQDQGQGQGQGQKPGQGQGKGQQPGKGREKNEGRGNGNRIADGQMNNGPSRIGDVRGEGMFIHLPPRQRELIKQALSDKLPPEYAALIQQYYVNIAKGKPAAQPAKPKP